MFAISRQRSRSESPTQLAKRLSVQRSSTNGQRVRVKKLHQCRGISARDRAPKNAAQVSIRKPPAHQTASNPCAHSRPITTRLTSTIDHANDGALILLGKSAGNLKLLPQRFLVRRSSLWPAIVTAEFPHKLVGETSSAGGHPFGKWPRFVARADSLVQSS